jgi:uncharacterized protein (TIGR02147 family)
MAEPDFRSYLASEFKVRQEKYRLRKRHYSLRQFARALGVEVSFLSKLLRGQRAMTFATIEKIGPKLRLSQEEIENFKLHHLRQKAGKPMPKKAEKPRFNELPFDQVGAITKWYYLPILELISQLGPEAKTTFFSERIAELLQISEAEIETELSDLEMLGILGRDSRGRLFLKEKNNRIPNRPVSTDALKSVQKQFLSKARDSIDRDSLEQRDHSGMTLTFPEERLLDAKKLIKNFRRRFMTLMERYAAQEPDRPRRVYHLSVSLFPLSKEFASNRKTS